MTEILYENKDIVFAVKPVGISSEDEFPKLLKEQLNSDIYTLHRLDKPVGGVMVYAKNKKAAAKFSTKIANREDFNKTYLALCEGVFEESEGVMEDLLFKDSSKNKSFVVKRERKGVKKAILKYKVLETGFYNETECSLVSITLETGRSHQIRVQFASRKHPLIGDKKYGSKIIAPLSLYSHKIETDGLSFEKEPPFSIEWKIKS